MRTTSGTFDAQFVISGMGPLSNPIPPDIPGLETFTGHSFHSARWDHDHDLSGKRVAVIGTGSSAAQFVPEIQPKVGGLLVFQRTPGWTFPRLNRRITDVERAVYRRWPLLQRTVRARQYLYREMVGFLVQHPGLIEPISKARMRWQVRDPELRAKLTPDYRMGCKRIIVTDDFHPALTKPNVSVITSRITEIRPTSIVTADGVEYEVDTLILGTGFQVMPVADPLTGADGVALAKRWANRREGYLGTTVAGYPNYFMLVGPNTATGHTSVLLYLEAQVEYIVQALRHMEWSGASSLERPHVAGNSLGGLIALELAARGVVRSATALSPAGFWNTPERVWCVAVFRIAGFLGARLPDAVVNRIVGNRVARASLYGLFFGRPSRYDAPDLIRDLRGLGREHRPAIDASLARFKHWPLPGPPAPGVPVTIAWGQRDLLLFPHQARRAQRAFPAARFVPLPGLGHVPMTDDPERVAALLLESSRL